MVQSSERFFTPTILQYSPQILQYVYFPIRPTQFVPYDMSFSSRRFPSIFLHITRPIHFFNPRFFFYPFILFDSSQFHTIRVRETERLSSPAPRSSTIIPLRAKPFSSVFSNSVPALINSSANGNFLSQNTRFAQTILPFSVTLHLQRSVRNRYAPFLVGRYGRLFVVLCYEPYY